MRPSMSKIVAFWAFSHDSAFTLLQDGLLAVAFQEGRLSRDTSCQIHTSSGVTALALTATASSQATLAES